MMATIIYGVGEAWPGPGTLPWDLLAAGQLGIEA